MSRTWLEVEVVLVGVADDERRDPGRVFAVGLSHSFGQLADAINAAFGRWDLSHLHEFELAGGRKIDAPPGRTGSTLPPGALPRRACSPSTRPVYGGGGA